MALSGNQKLSGQKVTLLNTTITTALTGGTAGTTTGLHGANYVGLMSVFTYGSGGTTCKVWLQTSFDYGVTWVDVLSHAFTTASLNKVGAVSTAAGFTPATPTDGTLADNTANQGLIGDRIRLKITTTGTYAGGTTLKVVAIIKG
jgi:hypothetical protein